MVWGDGPWFAAGETDWHPGQFYKLRAVYGEHKHYGPQITELVAIRPATDADLADGFDPAQLVESSRYDPETMFAELKALATSQIVDEPLRKLVLTLLDKYAGPLKRLPATRDRFHTFAGGLLEHTLAVTPRPCGWRMPTPPTIRS